ncbi:hypothetical protein [Chitinophaga sp. MM2321]|uniref:hypothetical protein n=1 Tax=Chitinophaga sp. MM2321 TaxID=3137178 RepID=UPI0032D5A665
MNKITPEEIQNIVCEEILREEVLLKYPSINIDLKWMIFAAMKRYAGRKVAEKDTELKTLTDKCASLLTTISQQQDQLQQAQDGIEEAVTQLEYLDKRFPTGTTPPVVSRLETLVTKLNQPAKEADKDE